MATNLSVIFNMIDNVSSKLASVGGAGRNTVNTFRNIEESANASFDRVSESADNIGRSFDRTSTSAGSLASSIKEYDGVLANVAESSNDFSSANQQAEEALSETVDAATRAADDVAELGEGMGEAGRNSKELGEKMEETARKSDELGDKFKETGDKSEEFGDKGKNSIDAIQGALVSAGLIALVHELSQEFEECAQKAETVETSVAQLQTIAGQDHIAQLSNEILDLSNDTGQAADGLAEVAYNAVSAGTKAEESVDMASSASKLAVAGFTDTASALSVVETALNSYGEAAGGAEHISDSLIQVQNLGVTTVRELAAQMGKGISTASAYNVSLENLESGYISITKAGINTAEGTTYIASMLNELGNATSDVSKVLKTETGETFGQLMKEGNSLADVLSILYNAADQNSEALMNMWGSAEAGKAANAIIGQGLETFNQNLATLKDGAGATQSAYEIMADTTEYSHQRMDNAIENTQLQIGNALNPVLSKMYNEFSEMAISVGKFVEENPVVVKVIASIAVGLGALTVAVAAATAAQALLNATMLANPVVWLIGGVAALAAGLVFLADSYDQATDSSDNLTVASQEHEEKMNDLNKQYDEACDKYGKNSEEANKLAGEIANLEASYDHAGETVGEFQKRINSLNDDIDKIHSTYEDNVTSADKLYDSSTLLIGELQALQSQTQLSNSQMTLMKNIVEELNGSYSDLNLTIDETTGKTNFSTTDLFDFAQQQHKQQKLDAASKGLMESLGKYTETQDAYKQSIKETSDSWDKYQEMEDKWINDHPILSEIGKGAEVNWSSDLGKQFDQWEKSNDAQNEASKAYDQLNDDIREYCDALGYGKEETEDFIEQLQNGSLSAEQSATKFGESGDTITSYADAVNGGVSSVKSSLEELAKKYDDAYDDALESFEGQYALWDKVENKSKTSVDKINNALQSQIDYWNNYANNLENLKGRDIKGLSDVLQNMDDGSEESAAALSAMARASDKEVEKIVQKYEKLQKAQGKTAGDVADLQTDFSGSLETMSHDLESSIKKMNMESDARSAATKTLQAYIDAINNKKGEAVSAAQAVADATSKALKSASESASSSLPSTPKVKIPKLPGHKSASEIASSSLPSIPKAKIPKLPGHASGTTDSEEVYVAGEEGPEIIVSGGGDTVFPTEETDRIISAIGDNDRQDNVQIATPVENRQSRMAAEESETTGGDRTVTLRIEGAGTISVGANTSKEEAWGAAKGKIKSAFMSLLKEEVYEEGAGAYEF